MAGSMNNICKSVFPKAKRVTDRFHVQKLANEAVQELRIKHRWLALDKENKAIQKAKKQGVKYKNPLLINGDSPKQLLIRSRYLLFKHLSKWTPKQTERVELLFSLYPEIEQGYRLSNQLFNINQSANNRGAFTKLARWYNEIEQAGFKSFRTVMRTV